MPTLALLDGHSIAYRAFFALPEDLATSSGQVTNAVYGFTRMLIKLLGDHHPDGLVVAWDVSRQTFRSEAYPEYKAQRKASPDNFKSQLPLIRKVLDALGVAQLEREGYEADDVVASVARLAVAEGWDVIVVTGDRDAFQLVDENVKVLYTRRGISDTVLADHAYVQDKYGIPPAKYVDYAALRGDNSDNLPGVPGVGEKTASRLVASYGGLEGIYEALDEQTPKLRENLAESREQVFLNRTLMKLVSDLELDSAPADLVRGTWDRKAAKDLFTSLEFHSLWSDLLEVQPDAEAGPVEVLDVEARVSTRPSGLSEVAARKRLVLGLVDDAGFDGLAVLEGDADAVLVPMDSLGPLREALEDPAVSKVAHHAKPLVGRLAAEGVELAGLAFDTALAAYVIDPAVRTYDLAEMALRYLGLEIESPDETEADRSAQGAFDFRDGPDLDAAARRVVVIDRLENRLRQELEERDELALFETYEMPLTVVLSKMERRGIGVDRTYLEGMGDDLRRRIGELERQIHEIAGEPFNVNSTDQLRTILFERLGLPVVKKTSTGKPSTDASVLDKLDHPMVTALSEYRELEKLRSTYVDGYLPLIKEDGRIHTTFNQMAASTGRLSSEEPNLQNIPVRSELGRTIRRAFVARPGCSFIVADYSQIELRVLAHMSGDPELVEAFRSGSDIHTATAARVFDVDEEAVTPEMRRRAKTINFGLLYGMEAFGLAQRLGIPRDEAAAQIEAYFARFPVVKAFMDGAVTEARRTGYTATLFGRRRYLPELKSDNFRIRQMGERMALNAPVQGTAADIIKKAMIDLETALDGSEAEMLLQIHDELILECTASELEWATAKTVEVMEAAVELAVPLVVDVATGPDLAAVKG